MCPGFPYYQLPNKRSMRFVKSSLLANKTLPTSERCFPLFQSSVSGRSVAQIPWCADTRNSARRSTSRSVGVTLVSRPFQPVRPDR